MFTLTTWCKIEIQMDQIFDRLTKVVTEVIIHKGGPFILPKLKRFKRGIKELKLS